MALGHSIPFIPLALALPPGPILAQPDLGVAAVVEIDLRDCLLDQRPHAPVQARDAAEPIHLIEQPLLLVPPFLLLLLHTPLKRGLLFAVFESS